MSPQTHDVRQRDRLVPGPIRLGDPVERPKGNDDDATDETPPPGAKIDRFTRVLRVEGDLDDDQLASVARIADRCPVHRTLEQASRIDTELAGSPTMLSRIHSMAGAA